MWVHCFHLQEKKIIIFLLTPNVCCCSLLSPLGKEEDKLKDNDKKDYKDNDDQGKDDNGKGKDKGRQGQGGSCCCQLWRGQGTAVIDDKGDNEEEAASAGAGLVVAVV